MNAWQDGEINLEQQTLNKKNSHRVATKIQKFTMPVACLYLGRFFKLSLEKLSQL